MDYDFKTWFHQENAIFVDPRIHPIHPFDLGNHGILVQSNIEKSSELLISISKNCCLHPSKNIDNKSTTSNNNSNNKAFPSTANMTPHQVLILLLLQELHLGKESRFQPYFDCLPKDVVQQLPCSWEEHELQQLHGTAVEPLVDCNLLKKVYDTVILPFMMNQDDGNTKSSLETKGYQQYLWAHSVIVSRAFTTSGVPWLLPLIDMANHNGDFPSAQIIETETSFELRSLCPLKAGDQVFISYGSLSNSQLLLDYGFVFASNRQDKVVLSFDTLIDMIIKKHYSKKSSQWIHQKKEKVNELQLPLLLLFNCFDDLLQDDVMSLFMVFAEVDDPDDLDFEVLMSVFIDILQEKKKQYFSKPTRKSIELLIHEEVTIINGVIKSFIMQSMEMADNDEDTEEDTEEDLV